jgi:hypothetical protein
MEKHGIARQATDDSIIRRMRFAYGFANTTDTHSEFLYLLLFHGNHGYANAPQCYVYTYTAFLFIYISNTTEHGHH